MEGMRIGMNIAESYRNIHFTKDGVVKRYLSISRFFNLYSSHKAVFAMPVDRNGFWHHLQMNCSIDEKNA